MNGKTVVNLVKVLNTAKTIMPIAIVAGFLFLLAFGFIRPTGDPIDHDAGVL
ncbi:MAG: hypothetical protein J7L55_00405 [Desulfurococcales archaeon]|nr:hypothetical protein [Desulfurococcales archaeon]